MRRFTSALSTLEEVVRRIKTASSRKRSAQSMPAIDTVRGTAILANPISEIPTMRRRIRGLRRFCSVLVIDISPGKKSV